MSDKITLVYMYFPVAIVQVGVMGAATALALVVLVVLALGDRASRSLKTTGGIAARTVLLLFPPAARNALTLLNCSPAAVSLAGCASLDGCSTSGGNSGRGSLVSVRLLESNPYYACWSAGGAHIAAGGLAVATLVVVVTAFPLVTLWAACPFQLAAEIQEQGVQVDRGDDSRGPGAVVINPLRLGAVTASSSRAAARATVSVMPDKSAHERHPSLAPFLSDYRPEVWYTRHADLALSLLLAALQVC